MIQSGPDHNINVPGIEITLVNKMTTNHRREVVVLHFLGTEAGLQRAGIVSRSNRPAGGVLSVSTKMAHADTAQCRRRSADSSTSCTSWECVVPPVAHSANKHL